MFSVYGFAEFLMVYFNAVLISLFNIDISKNYKFVLLILIILYIFAIFSLSRYLSNKIKIKSFYAKVSFDLYGKHIEFNGLIDSGNCLYDSKTGKAVIVCSINSLQRYFSKVSMEELKNYPGFRMINCTTVSNDNYKLSVIDMDNVFIETNSEKKLKKCVLGVVDRKFLRKKIDCLIHRDLI